MINDLKILICVNYIFFFYVWSLGLMLSFKFQFKSFNYLVLQQFCCCILIRNYHFDLKRFFELFFIE